MANLYLVCGFYGSGKTTLAKELAAKNGISLIDVDEYYRKINGDECDRQNPFDVWITVYKDIHDAELSNKDIVFTASYLQTTQRRELLTWFSSFNFHLIWVMAPLNVCLENNNKRTRKVPMDKFEKGWEMMEIPSPNEDTWQTITHIYNFNNDGTHNILKLKGDLGKFVEL